MEPRRRSSTAERSYTAAQQKSLVKELVSCLHSTYRVQMKAMCRYFWCPDFNL
uniref:Uncharacterized protein n=1 Tax=Oryza glumipatula TaxID=40148 RepID=A0A0D9Z429_9ORYZ